MIPDTLFYDLYHFYINYYKSIDYRIVTPNAAANEAAKIGFSAVEPTTVSAQRRQ